MLALRELVALLLSKNVTGVRPRCNATSSEYFLHTSHCTLHTLHFTLHTCTSHSTAHLISNHLISFHLMSPHLTSSHLIPSLLTCHLSNSSQLFSCHPITEKSSSQLISAPLHARKLLPTKLAQSTSEYYFVQQSLHKVLPSTTPYNKACTKYFSVLLHTTELAQSTSQ